MFYEVRLEAVKVKGSNSLRGTILKSPFDLVRITSMSIPNYVRERKGRERKKERKKLVIVKLLKQSKSDHIVGSKKV